MEFRVLGPLAALVEGHDVTPSRAQARTLLALLLLHPNERLTSDRIIEAIWGDTPPATADKALQGHISTLRKSLGASRIQTEQGGYRLEVADAERDLERFIKLLDVARATRHPSERSQVLRDALALWRGEPLADFADADFAQTEIARLQALRLVAEEERIDAELVLGHHLEVLPELERLVADQPFAEGLAAKLMLALYRSGRQSDALRVYRETRRRLTEDLGIDPGAELQLLERQILGQDPAIAAPILAAEPVSRRQERKVVTVLVIEIEPKQPTDPEDLEGIVAPAIDNARAVIGRAGGTAEPLFANAVMGLFGAPRVHDDDALRAVRASLELVELPLGDGLLLRGGIETGTALVTIEGDRVAVTGDVLSAASRLQLIAEPGSIVVGDATHRLTADAMAYLDRGGGRWSPIGRRPTSLSARAEAPLVGRSDELGQLERIVARARDGRSVQLATITAEPGGGKSRLLRELRARVAAGDVLPGTVRWLQGRCLPYGNGLTFWALGAVIREWAGILESDDATASTAKLRSSVAALEPDDGDLRSWLERSAAALMGVDDAIRPGEGDVGFAAWRRLVEAIAAERPLVVAFEDIHWADEALLAFIDHVVEHASPVPLVVLCTARPELLDVRPMWGAGKRNAASILLQPLSDGETRRLLETLLGRPADAETVRRAGGNPLFAHELARLKSDPALTSGPIPESLEAVIAAHLDALAPDLKVVAANAAVVGEVFWPGAVAKVGGMDQARVATLLHRLIATEVVRRRLRSTVAGEDEYEFLHVLVRDVAYGQIPRRDRIGKHRSAAAWIEQLTEDRPTAHAELAAHHYVEALELATRLGGDVQAAELTTRAVAALTLAGDGARALDVAKASRLYRRAMDLMGSDDRDRPSLLARLGDVAQLAGDLEEAERLTRAAIDGLLVADDANAAAAAMVSLESVSWRLGRAEADRRELLHHAIDLLERHPPNAELVHAYAQMAAHELYRGASAECLAWSSRALAVAKSLGVPALQFQPRHYLGIARFEQGDVGGIDDVRAAIALGLEAGLSWETAHAQADLGAMVWLQHGPGPAIPLKSAAASFAEGRGMTALAETTRAQTLWMQYDLGAWDDMLDAANRLLATAADDRGRITMIARSTMARVLVGRGRAVEAVDLAEDVLERGRAIGDAQDLDPSLATAAYVRSAVGDRQAALALIEELDTRSLGVDLSARAHDLALVARICLANGAAELVRPFVPETDTPSPTRGRLGVATARAIMAEARGDLEIAERVYASAARGWAAYGCLEEEAHALLGESRCLAAAGRAHPEGLATAERLGRRLGAVRIVEEAERLLPGSAA